MKKLVILIALALGVAGAPAGSASAASGWTQVNVPSNGNNISRLGASADTSTDAWAVGQQFVAAGQPPATGVAYHWTGTAWTLTPTPELGQYAALDGVSSSSPTDAWVVWFTMIRKFDYGTLTEHWNSSTWSASSVDAITGYAARLTAVVDLTPTNTWAVGEGSSSGVIEHWNGTPWSVVNLPDPDLSPANGNAISADSANDIWVVGSTVSAASDAIVPETLH